MQHDQTYDRRVSESLLEGPEGPLAPLLSWSKSDPALRDVQLRKQPKGKRSWASLYLGLTSVLNVEEDGTGQFRLSAHQTHRTKGHFDDDWGRWQAIDDLALPDVLSYLHRIADRVDARWTEAEGWVHALVATTPHLGAAVIDREASHAFRNRAAKDDRLHTWRTPLQAALAAVPSPGAWWAATERIAYGTSPDFLAVDDQGRLLVLEAKPSTVLQGLALSPAQVALYARMYATWLEETPQARQVLQEELGQRARLGLVLGPRPKLTDPPQVVPVVTVGPRAGIAGCLVTSAAGCPSGAGRSDTRPGPAAGGLGPRRRGSSHCLAVAGRGRAAPGVIPTAGGQDDIPRAGPSPRTRMEAERPGRGRGRRIPALQR